MIPPPPTRKLHSLKLTVRPTKNEGFQVQHLLFHPKNFKIFLSFREGSKPWNPPKKWFHPLEPSPQNLGVSVPRLWRSNTIHCLQRQRPFSAAEGWMTKTQGTHQKCREQKPIEFFRNKKDTSEFYQLENTSWLFFLHFLTVSSRCFEWFSFNGWSSYIILYMFFFESVRGYFIIPEQGGPAAVIGGVLTPLTEVITPVTHLFSANYSGRK